MNTIERIKPGAKPINRLHALSGIKYQQLQTQKSRNKHDYFRRDVAILLCTSLILCLITIIVLALLPSVFGQVKAALIASGNDTSLYNG